MNFTMKLQEPYCHNLVQSNPNCNPNRTLTLTTHQVIDVIAINDERFLRAIQYAVGDALVCDSLDEARILYQPLCLAALLACHAHARLPRRGATG